MPGTNDKELMFTFEFNRNDLPGLRVIRFTGHEEVSHLFRFEITLVGDTADIDFDAVLNAGATLRIWSRDHATSVAYRGMVAEFEQEGRVDNYHFYRLVLVPRLWRLNLNRLNEVYLDDKRIPELIEAILARNGLRGPDVQIPAKESRHYRQRSFICQYEESDLAFISRWMEQEGMYYFFEHEDESASGEVLQIIDDKKAQPEKSVTLRYTPPENVQTSMQDTCVTAFTRRKTHVPGSVLVQDFNFRKASLGDDLKTEKTVAGGRSGVYMYYGDNLRSESDTEYMAKVRAEALSCRQTLYSGTAPAIGIRSGRYVEITHATASAGALPPCAANSARRHSEWDHAAHRRHAATRKFPDRPARRLAGSLRRPMAGTCRGARARPRIAQMACASRNARPGTPGRLA